MKKNKLTGMALGMALMTNSSAQSYFKEDGTKTHDLEIAAATWRTKEFLKDHALAGVKAEYAYAYGFTGAGMKIGMVDSGVFAGHPQLMGQYTPLTVQGRYSADGAQLDGSSKTWKKGESFNISGNYDPFFNDSHGTSAAGEMVAKRYATIDANKIRMHGIAFDAHLYSVNSGGNDNTVYGPNVDYAYFKEAYGILSRNGARVVNSSWGQEASDAGNYGTLQGITALYARFKGNETLLDAAAEVSSQYKTIQVWANGNTGYNNPRAIASLPYFRPETEKYWIAVTGVTKNDRSKFDRCGIAKYWCMAGPTENIATTSVGTRGDENERDFGGHTPASLLKSPLKPAYRTTYSGTSAAAPNVTASLALIMQRFPYLSNEAARDILFTTATHLGDGPDDLSNAAFGWGKPNLRKAMAGPGQFLGAYEANLPSGVLDTWSNDISDKALEQRRKEDAAELKAWAEEVQKRGWTNGLPANASDTDKLDFTIGRAREKARQERAYQGSLIKGGPGVLVLAGANTYGGGSTVNGGELRIDGSISSPATVNRDGLLRVNGSTSAATINPGGMLKVNASGTTGNVDIRGGIASIDGSSQAVSVTAGGILGGNGTLASLNAGAGGVVKPGNSIGTLKVVGDTTFSSGSTYAVEVSPDGQRSDLIQSSGRVTLDNPTMIVSLENAPAPLSSSELKALLGKRFSVLSAAKGITGQFGQVVPNYQFLGAMLAYDSMGVDLTMDRNTTAFASAATNANQRRLANALEGVPQDNAAYGALLLTATPQAAEALLRQFNGDIYPAAQGMLINESRHVRNAALDRLGPAASDPRADARPVSVWTQALGSWGKARGSDGAFGYTSSTGGFLAGADLALRETVRVGGLAGYSHHSVNLGDAPSSARFDSFHLGAYAGWQPGPFGLRGGVVQSWHQGKTKRSLDYGSGSETARNTLDARTTQVFGELGYRLQASAVTQIEPFGRLAYLHFDSDGHQERGSDAALRVHASKNDVMFSMLGLNLASQFWLLAERALTVKAQLAWQHKLSGQTPNAALSFVAGGESFTVRGASIANDAAVVNASVALPLGKHGSATLGYAGLIASRFGDHAVTGNLAWRF